MKTWFLCKAKYTAEDENGIFRNKSEAYLVDAVSFTEAEAKMYEAMSERIRGEFSIASISKSNIIDTFYYPDADIWYKCKVQYYVAEESGKEKKITNYMLVTAHDVKEAYERIHLSLNNMLVTFRVPDITESPIVEVLDIEDSAEKLPAGNWSKVASEE
jgi:hypothetical protein